MATRVARSLNADSLAHGLMRSVCTSRFTKSNGVAVASSMPQLFRPVERALHLVELRASEVPLKLKDESTALDRNRGGDIGTSTTAQQSRRNRAL